MPAVSVRVCFFPFNFVFNLVWLAVNGAWLVLGINDTTRDTPLLEFSQVRATPIDGTPLLLCLPSCWMKAPLFFSLFLLFFQLIKESDGHKRAFWGDMKMGEGERRSPVQMRWRAAQPPCLPECIRGAESEQPAPAGCSLSFPLSDPRFQVSPAYFGSHPVRWPFLSYRLSPSGFGEGGCRRRGAAPQWISGWHGGGSLLGVCALARVPACLF